MTRKHFVQIAAALRAWREDSAKHLGPEVTRGVDHTARVLADVLATTNPRFDRDRFLKACGAQP